MLEIAALVILTKRIGKIVSHKGYQPGWYKLMVIGLWLAGEFTGGIAGTLIADHRLGTYIGALLGAVIGASIALLSATHPEFLYRWWGLLSGVITIAIAVGAAIGIASANINHNTWQWGIVNALYCFFFSSLLGVTLYQSILNQSRFRAIFVAIVISAWAIFGITFMKPGFEPGDSPGLVMLAMTLLAVLWSAIESFRPTLPKKLVTSDT